MAKGVPHYFRDGTKHSGGTHKMPDGSVHSGKTHGASSKKLFHLNELSKTAKEKAMAYGMKKKPAPKKKKKAAPKKVKPMKRGGY
ncbi:hypothetical protein [Limnobacter sp.]|uniref:hypothetical protein n=1 Tax=Limnobacter sp. TaxID=2003368 RepID=UPI0025BB71B9|nr:hypothetical protein [Limnobacter sp.]